MSWAVERSSEREGFEPCPPDSMPAGATYRDEPVVHHAGGHVADGRTVVDVPGRQWPAARPEDCADESLAGEWLNEYLQVCRGCGLDTT